MRLEEWQKFIESQFLEDGGVKEPEPVSEAVAVVSVSKPETDTSAIEIPTLTLPFADDAPVIPVAEAAKLQPEANVALTSEEGTDAPPERTMETPAYRQTLDFDTEIPDFASYMPLARGGKAASVSEPETGVASEVETPQGDAAPRPVAVHENRILDADSLTRSERKPKSRARHARNARPENVPSGLAAAAMWADVPRHVQTLLALERIEEEEIAQSSYKRPFAEGRLELIERLLDPILSLEDTARLLNVCPTTVRRYTNRGILTHYRKEPERNTEPSRPTERENPSTSLPPVRHSGVSGNPAGRARRGTEN